MSNYFAIAFTCVYLTLTVGVAKTTHYCMGQEKYSSLFSFTTKKCPCSLFARDASPCCDDQHEILKINDDQSGGHITAPPAPHFNLIRDLYLVQEELASTYTQRVNPAVEVNIPPPKVPLYQSFCSLVFYDSLV